MRVLIIFCMVFSLYGCAGIPPKLEITGEDQFIVDIFRYDTDHEREVEKQLSEYGVCKNGYEIISTDYFVFGCTLGDCRGKRYVGTCKSL